jgi:crotonobetainyl-CoA:carnitine CoA-transferase CaiB-like acyl-CoA transferase
MIDRAVFPTRRRRKHARPQELLDAAFGLFIERVRCGPAGSALPGIAPSNAYLCKDEGYALIAGNGDSFFKHLMAVNDRADPRRLAAASTFTHGKR